MRFLLIILFLTCAAATPAAAYNENFREEAKELLEKDKHAAALHVLARAGSDVKQMMPSMKKLNALRFLGEVYWLAGKPKRGQEYFVEAMELALKTKTIWKRLSAVISVLEIHRHTTQNAKKLEPLLRKTLKAKLLPEMAENKHATEIGRYVRSFAGADRLTIVALLTQLRGIAQPPVRSKALFALSEIPFSKDNDNYIAMEESAAYNAPILEQLMWHAAMARVFDAPASRAKHNSHKKRAELLLSQLPKDKKASGKKIIKAIGSSAGQ